MSNELLVMNENDELIVNPSIREEIVRIENAKKELDRQYKEYKEALLEAMEQNGIKKFESDEIVITYVEPTERFGIDTKKLWKDYKKVALECETLTPVKASIRIKVRGGNDE